MDGPCLAKLLLSGVLASVPPLSAEQTARLSGAVEDADHHDEAFLALVENVRTWTAGLGDSPIRLHPDFAAMTREPSNHRGELCRVSGMLQQATRLGAPFDDVSEWFLRSSDGRAVIVYVLHPDEPRKFAERDLVEIDAWFYKRMEFAGRDGWNHVYPAFVGAFPGLRLDNNAAATSPMSATAIGGLVVFLAMIFVGVWMWARRSGSHVGGARTIRQRRVMADFESPPVDGEGALPDDPVQALAELKRRADPE